MLGLLARVSAELAARSIPHALVGAAAMAVHGISRSTFDADLFTTDRAVLDQALWSALAAEATAVDLRVGDADDPLAGVVRFAREGQRSVDLVVGRDRWQAEVIARAVPTPLGGAEIPVVTPADLVLLKLHAGGPQDAWDVTQLLSAVGADALVPHVEAQLSRLPVEARALWDRIRRG
jgi:hypothetical protein